MWRVWEQSGSFQGSALKGFQHHEKITKGRQRGGLCCFCCTHIPVYLWHIQPHPHTQLGVLPSSALGYNFWVIYSSADMALIRVWARELTARRRCVPDVSRNSKRFVKKRNRALQELTKETWVRENCWGIRKNRGKGASCSIMGTDLTHQNSGLYK